MQGRGGGLNIRAKKGLKKRWILSDLSRSPLLKSLLSALLLRAVLKSVGRCFSSESAASTCASAATQRVPQLGHEKQLSLSLSLIHLKKKGLLFRKIF